MTENAPDLKQQAADLLTQLQQRFPVMAQHLPLKIGVYDDLATACPDVAPEVLRLAMRMHCNHGGYLEATGTDHSMRYDLAGQPTELVSKEHQYIAAVKLATRQAKQQRNDAGQGQGAFKPKASPKAPAAKSAAAPAVKPAVVTAKVSQGGTLTLAKRNPAAR